MGMCSQAGSAESRRFGLSFLTDNIDICHHRLPLPAAASDKLDASFILQNSATTVRPVWTKDHYVIEVNVKGSGVLTELGSVMDLNDRKAISEMEASLEQRVLELMNNSLAEVKRLGADVTGFAVRIHRSDPKRWKQIEQEKRWDSVFQEIELRPQVSIEMERTRAQQ